VQLSDLGEFGFLDRVRSWLPHGNALVGPGDDAAVVEVAGGRLVATTDALVDGIHFRADWSSPGDIGHKAVAVNASDVAAMAGDPRWMLVTICADPASSVDSLEELYRGMVAAASEYGVEIVGGDTVRSDTFVISVTALGELEGDPLLRSGARPGDTIAVTGPLGRAAAGVNLLLSGDPRDVTPDDALACIDAHRRPRARIGEGKRLRDAGAGAAIDVTDGLASDARRVADASGVGIEIDADRLPVAREVASVASSRGWNAEQIVLGGGEDLELLVAIPAELDAQALGLIPCGRVVDDGLWLVRDGRRTPLQEEGFDHFGGALG
jgi:thiamine-monophosphate kinase